MRIIVLYKIDSNTVGKMINVISLLHDETTYVINSEKELFAQVGKGIDILCLPSHLHPIAIFLSGVNRCMQIIYLTPRTSLISVPCFENTHFLCTPFSSMRLNSILDKAKTHASQLKKRFTYLEDNQQKSILKKRIFYLQSENHKISFHMKNSSTLTLDGYLIDIIPYFSRPHFVIPHPFYIVQLAKIHEINKSFIILKNKEKIPMIENLRISIMRDYLTHL